MEEDINHILEVTQRKLVVAESDIDLTSHRKNRIFVLMVQESAGSAGGRAGGSGSRKINRIFGFLCNDGICKKDFETIQEETIERFDIPYSAVAMDVKLSSGNSLVVQGVIDSEFAQAYDKVINSLK